MNKEKFIPMPPEKGEIDLDKKNDNERLFVSPSGTIETFNDENPVEEAAEYQENKKEYLG